MNAQDLKNSILQLAVQGKLVEQRPEEGTAKELLEQIKAEKEKLIKEKKIKKEKPLPEIMEEDIPFEIPKSWEWVRLIDLCCLISDGTHKTPTYVEQGVPFVSVKDISSGYLDFSNVKYITQEEHEKLISRCKPEIHDILLCRIGTLGKAIKIDTDREFSIFVSLGILKLLNSDLADYIVTVINSGYGYRWIDANKVGGGTHTNKINLDSLRGMPIPVPPLTEQKRIVAKIEEILPYIDQYDKAYTKLETFNKKFPEDMKKSILQLAMQGKLVEQRPEEGTADELYEQIVAEKAQLIKDGKIKKEKPLPEITEDEIPFEIPSSWKWVRWGTLSFSIQYGYNAPAIANGHYRMVRISDIQDNQVLWDSVPYCEILDKEAESYLLAKNDILFARTGGTVGKSFLVKDVPYEAVYAGYLIRTRYNFEKIVPEYLKFFMESQLYWQQLRNGTIATAQPNCNGQTLSKMLIPLPPLAEQKRIVAKIEELLPYCDQLVK